LERLALIAFLLSFLESVTKQALFAELNISRPNKKSNRETTQHFQGNINNPFVHKILIPKAKPAHAGQTDLGLWS
jgi:hypothetical protein